MAQAPTRAQIADLPVPHERFSQPYRNGWRDAMSVVLCLYDTAQPSADAQVVNREQIEALPRYSVYLSRGTVRENPDGLMVLRSDVLALFPPSPSAGGTDGR